MIRFRLLEAADLPMLLDWLQRPHVKQWWDDGDDSLEKVIAHYGDDSDGTRRFILDVGGEAAGYFQYYRIDAATIGADQFLARASDLSKGLGTRCLLAFIDLVIISESPAAILVDPHPTNLRAIRCYAKCGFVHQSDLSTAAVHTMTKNLADG